MAGGPHTSREAPLCSLAERAMGGSGPHPVPSQRPAWAPPAPPKWEQRADGLALPLLGRDTGPGALLELLVSPWGHGALGDHGPSERPPCRALQTGRGHHCRSAIPQTRQRRHVLEKHRQIIGLFP